MATLSTVVTGTALAVTVALVPSLAAPAGGSTTGGARTSGSVLLRSPLVGSRTSDPPLFGAVPGTVDEAASRSRVVVRADGRIDARVRGLIQPREAGNPIPLLAASLVCNGEVVARTDPVPFDEAGHADVHQRLTVPERCLAPAVLINPLDRDGVYIAASGRG
jgi:hypothetical protein